MWTFMNEAVSIDNCTSTLSFINFGTSMSYRT